MGGGHLSTLNIDPGSLCNVEYRPGIPRGSVCNVTGNIKYWPPWNTDPRVCRYQSDLFKVGFIMSRLVCRIITIWHEIRNQKHAVVFKFVCTCYNCSGIILFLLVTRVSEWGTFEGCLCRHIRRLQLMLLVSQPSLVGISMLLYPYGRGER